MKSKMIYIIGLILCLILTIILYIGGEVSIALFTLFGVLIFSVLLIKNNNLNKSPESQYLGTVNNILKTYDSILVEIKEFPDLTDKKLIKTLSFKDMLNTEYELRKPVYYISNEFAYDFMIIDAEDVYTYTVRRNDLVKSLLDEYIDKKNQETNEAERELNMLDSLDETVIIEVDGDKKFKVSPMREK